MYEISLLKSPCYSRFCPTQSCHPQDEIIPEIIRNTTATTTPDDLQKMAAAQTGNYVYFFDKKIMGEILKQSLLVTNQIYFFLQNY